MIDCSLLFAVIEIQRECKRRQGSRRKHSLDNLKGKKLCTRILRRKHWIAFGGEIALEMAMDLSQDRPQNNELINFIVNRLGQLRMGRSKQQALTIHG
jgi:hypothetical protein